MVNRENHKEEGGPPQGDRQTDGNAHTHSHSHSPPISKQLKSKQKPVPQDKRKLRLSSSQALCKRLCLRTHTDFTFNRQGFLLYSSSCHTPLLSSPFVVYIISVETERAACKGTAQTTFKMAINRKP